MRRAEQMLLDGQGAAEERRGVIVAALRQTERQQVLDRGRGQRMLPATRLLGQRQRLPAERLGSVVEALRTVDER